MDNFWNKTKSFWLFTLAAGIVRGILIGRYGFWGDEGMSIILTGPKFSFAQVLEYSHKVDYCSFVWNILFHLWTNIFGTSEISARFPSLIFGALTVGFIFLLAKEIFGKDVAPFVGFISILSPYLIHLSIEARAYALLALIGTFSTFCLLQIVKDKEKPNSKWLYFYSATILVGIYTNPFTYLFWFCQLVFLLGFHKVKKNILFSQLTVLLLALPHFFLILQSVQQFRPIKPLSGYALQKLLGVLFRFPYGYILPTGTKDEVTEIINSFPLLLAIGLGLWVGWLFVFKGIKQGEQKKVFNGKVLFSLFIGFIFLVWMIFPVRLSPRQCSLVAPFFFLLFGAGLNLSAKSFWEYSYKVIVFGLIFTSLFTQFKGTEHPYSRTNYKDLIQLISEKQIPGRAIFILRNSRPELPPAQKPDYPLDEEQYDGVICLFKYYTNGTITPQVLYYLDELEDNLLKEKQVLLIWPKNVGPQNPLPKISDMAISTGKTILHFDSFGSRLGVIVLTGN